MCAEFSLSVIQISKYCLPSCTTRHHFNIHVFNKKINTNCGIFKADFIWVLSYYLICQHEKERLTFDFNISRLHIEFYGFNKRHFDSNWNIYLIYHVSLCLSHPFHSFTFFPFISVNYLVNLRCSHILRWTHSFRKTEWLARGTFSWHQQISFQNCGLTSLLHISFEYTK